VPTLGIHTARGSGRLRAYLAWGALLFGFAIPVTYSLEGMRAALLAGAGWNQLWPSIAALLVFAVILIPASFVVFAWSLRRTKITGMLTHI
jgi:ABC-type multidrug transport system permease subunit